MCNLKKNEDLSRNCIIQATYYVIFNYYDILQSFYNSILKIIRTKFRTQCNEWNQRCITCDDPVQKLVAVIMVPLQKCQW